MRQNSVFSFIKVCFIWSQTDYPIYFKFLDMGENCNMLFELVLFISCKMNL